MLGGPGHSLFLLRGLFTHFLLLGVAPLVGGLLPGVSLGANPHFTRIGIAATTATTPWRIMTALAGRAITPNPHFCFFTPYDAWFAPAPEVYRTPNTHFWVFGCVFALTLTFPAFWVFRALFPGAKPHLFPHSSHSQHPNPHFFPVFRVLMINVPVFPGG